MKKKALVLLMLGFVLLFTSTVSASETEPKNIALGKTYTVKMRYHNQASINDERYYPDTSSELTNGKYASEKYSDREWTGFAQGFEREVIVDLGENCSLRKLSANFLRCSAAGIKLPRWVKFEISQDGLRWEEAGRAEYPLKPYDVVDKTVKYEIEELNLAGRFVRYTIPVEVWIFIDEVEAIGFEGIQDDARLVQGEVDQKLRTGEYIKQGAIEAGGAKHIMLIYTGHHSDKTIPTWTVDDFLPYVAYMEANQIKDWFFDSFLFLPLRYSSSGHSYIEANNISQAANMYDWLEYHEWNFRKDQQLDALNAAVGKAKEVLGDKDYKAKVILTTVYPSPVQDYFGDVDEDGEVENHYYSRPQAIEAGKKVVKWYLDLLLQSWQEKKYENLELIGFYWVQEEVGFASSRFEEAMIQETSRLIHDCGYRFFWIPYLRSGLYYDWERLGFDAAMMQPNYMWSNLGKSLLKNNAELTKAAGMGIEMELNAFHGQESDTKWLEYLNAGVEFGYMNDALLGYYQNVKDVGKAAKLADNNRKIYYDYLYQFVKGTYEIVPVK